MNINRRYIYKLVLSFLLLGFAQQFALAQHAGKPTALDRYVQTPDSNYKFQLKNTTPGIGFTSYLIEMTSQSWRQPSEVNRSLWKHWLIIVRPDKVNYTTGFLFIAGGSNNDPEPKIDPLLIETATTTNSVVAQLRMVPNQPLVFADDGKPLVEDGFIAYTWDKFLRTGDADWLARLPMTKSVVRAMDTVTTFCGSSQGGDTKVERFVVAGGSKRGWTTWTTAAVDRRVVGIIPMVIDLLNLEKSLTHHYQAYGFWAPAIKDYEKNGIMNWMRTTQFKSMMKIVEPYSYRDRLTMPKFLINAAGDQFFLPDSSQFYFDDLKGEKYLRYVPNTDHSLRNSDAQQSLIAYYDAALRGEPRPRFSWKFEKNGAIQVRSIDKPSEVKLWQATNPSKRDFRLETIGAAYKSSSLSEQGKGVYVARVEKPPTGWTAFFVELTFPSGGKYPFKFTTAVRVVPDTLPFKPPVHDRSKIKEAGK
jgi:PhoPQ-activated pathogenicity-related protein